MGRPFIQEPTTRRGREGLQQSKSSTSKSLNGDSQQVVVKSERVSLMLLKKLMATSILWPRSASVRVRTSEADATGVPFLHFYCHPHSRVGDQAHQALPFWKPLFLRLPLPYSVSSYCCSVAKCPTLYDPMDCSTPGFSVLYYLLKFAQIRIL